MPSGRPVLVLAVLVLVAACLGPTTVGTPTDGPPGATATPTAKPTPVDADLPPGVDRTGVADADRLLAAHEAALNRTSAHRVHATRRVVLASGETTRPMNRTVYRWSTRSSDVVRLREAANVAGGPYELVARGPAVVQRNAAPGSGPRYEYRYAATGDGLVAVTDPDARTVVPAAAGPSLLLEYALSGGDFRVTNATERTVTLTATGPAPDTEHAGYSATLEVTAAGLVRHLEGTLTEADGTRVSFSYEAAVDVRPPPIPAWTGEVPQLVPVRTPDGRLVVVENRGGPALPAGTRLSVGLAGPDTDVRDEVVLPERLEPPGNGSADASYLYAVRTSSGVDVRVAAEPEQTLNVSKVNLLGRTVVITHRGERVQFELRLEREEGE